MDDSAVSRSIDLYRGQLTLPLKLAVLEGPAGMSMNVQASYQSHVAQDVRIWNRTLPTDILGLGWQMGMDQILVLGSDQRATYGRKFSYLTDGGFHSLYRVGTSKDGGIAYQMREHQFWQITYYPAQGGGIGYWKVVREDGITRCYGGTEAAVQWSVAWDNWRGASIVQGADSYESAWMLSHLKSPDNDVVEYQYESTLIELGGAKYTQSLRVASVRGAYGQCATLSYCDKEPFEIDPKHVSPSSREVSAYQTLYQEKYLDSVSLLNPSGTLVYRQELKYDFLGDASQGLKKRYLKAVAQTIPNQETLPPIQYAYSQAAGDFGRLTKQTSPLGAHIDYTYQSQSLFEVAAEITVPGGFKPQVWYGDSNLTVFSFYNAALKRLQLQVYTWKGQWIVWEDEQLSGFAVGDFSVSVSADFFVLKYHDLNTELENVRLYHRNINQDDTFLVEDLKLDASYQDFQLAVGVDFVAIQSPGQSALSVWQYLGLSKTWSSQQVSIGIETDNLSLAAGDGFVLAAYNVRDSASNVRLQSFFVDADYQWRVADNRDLADVSIDWKLTEPGTVWSVGSSLASATFVAAQDLSEDQSKNPPEPSEVESTIIFVRYRENFQLADSQSFTVKQDTSTKNPVGYAVTDQSQTGLAQYLFRYNPSSWVHSNLLSTTTHRVYRYAYGNSLALGVEKTASGEQTFFAKRYDPYRNQWVTEGVPNSVPRSENNICLPVIDGNYAILGLNLFHKNPDESWQRIDSLPDNIITDSVQLHASESEGYLLFRYASSVETEIRLLENGAVSTRFRLDGENTYVHDPKGGNYLSNLSYFVTFEGSDFSTARKLKLRRLLHSNSLEKTDVVLITQAVLDNGFNSQSLKVAYGTSNIAAGFSGDIPQFSHTNLCYGAQSEGGCTEHFFFNGLKEGIPPDSDVSNASQFYSLLAGQLWGQINRNAIGRVTRESSHDLFSYDGDQKLYGIYTRVKRQQDIHWSILFSCDISLRDELDKSKFPPSLEQEFAEYGFPIEAAVVTVVSSGLLWKIQAGDTVYWIENEDGQLFVYGALEQCEDKDYNLYGQLRRTTSHTMNSRGEPESYQKEVNYAWEVYPELLDLNILTPESQRLKRNTQGKISHLEVQTWKKDWPSASVWARHGRYQYRGSGDSRFDYQNWSDTPPPIEYWLCTNQILDRNLSGQVLVKRDLGGLHGAMFYDHDTRFPVAQFTNLQADQAASVMFYGFEAYETPLGKFSSGAVIEIGRAYAGSRCLKLSPGASWQFRHTLAFEQNYSISFHYRSDCDKAGLRLTAVNAKAQTEVRTFALGATSGTWEHAYFTVRPCDFSLEDITAFELEWLNQDTDNTLSVDGVFLAPSVSGGRALIYNDDLLQEATLDFHGGDSWTVYDHLQRDIAVLNREGQLMKADLIGNWSLTAESFDPVAPHQVCGLTTLTADSQVWLSGKAKPADTAWCFADTFAYQGACMKGSGRIVPSRKPAADFAFNTLLTFDATTQLSFNAPGAFAVVWQDGTWRLCDAQGKTLEQIKDQSLTACRNLTLTFRNGQVYFLAQGRVVFNQKIAARADGFSLEIEGETTLEMLALINSPILEVSYYDNAYHLLQSQSVLDDGVVTQAMLRDDLGRPDTFLRGVVQNEFSYNQTLVDSYDRETGILKGPINDSYPQDQGYPYSRTRYSTCPDSHVLETGAPGKTLAIDLSIGSSTRKTLKKQSYLNVRDEAVPELPPGQYLVEKNTSQDGMFAETWADRLGRIVFQREGMDGTFALTRHYYDENGNLTEILLPNSFEAGRSPSKRTLTYDFLGREISASEPNQSGTTDTIYNRLSQKIFVKSPKGEVTYFRYDDRGRVTEQGIAAVIWDRAGLQKKADAGDFDGLNLNFAQKFIYDTSGTDPDSVNQLIEVQTASGSEQNLVRERFFYNSQRLLQKRNQEVVGIDPVGGQTVQFQYNLQNKITAIQRLGKSQLEEQVLYEYQDHQIKTISWQPTPKQDAVQIAAYEYGPEGHVLSETLGDGSDAFTRRYQYQSAGFLESVQDPFLNSEYSYFSGGYQDYESYQGQIAGLTETWSKLPEVSLASEYSLKLAYDKLGRLSVAESPQLPEANLGVDENISYDANGNVLSLSVDTEKHTYSYHQDQLKSIMPGEQEFSYDADGELTQSSTIESLSYDVFSGMVAEMQVSGGPRLSFRRAGNARRVYKGLDDGSYNVSMAGQNHIPFWRENFDRSGRSSGRVWYIQGASGLVAVIAQDRIYSVIKDHLSSVRGLVRQGNLMAAYNYQAYGSFLGKPYESEEVQGLCPFLFTSQEWDCESGLYAFTNRFYDPGYSRFISMDKAMQFDSPYVYAGNDPMNLVDPTGNFSLIAGLVNLFVGIVVVAVGIITMIATAGASTPGVVAALAVTTGALIGAGAGMAGYGIQSLANGGGGYNGGANAFSGLFGLVVGGITGGIGLLTGFIPSAAGAFLASVGIGVVSGGSSSLISNGVINVINHQSFSQGAGMAFLYGFVLGGVTAAIGGVVGRGLALRNNLIVRGWSEEPSTLGFKLAGGIGRTPDFSEAFAEDGLDAAKGSVNHVKLYVGSEAENFNDGLTVEGTIEGTGKLMMETDAIDSERLATSIGHDSIKMRSLTLPDKLGQAAVGHPGQTVLEGRLASLGRYSLVTNNCVTVAKKATYLLTGLGSGRSGLVAPLWVRTPASYLTWLKTLGARPYLRVQMPTIRLGQSSL